MLSRVVILLISVILFVDYFQQVQAQTNVPRFEITTCDFAVPDGYEPECGNLIVQEDRSDPDSPTIALGVAIYRSLSTNPQPDPRLESRRQRSQQCAIQPLSTRR